MTKVKGAKGEVAAMGAVEDALESLAPEERGRVLRWAGERFGIPLSQPSKTRNDTQQASKLDIGSPEHFEDAGEFYAHAAPATEPERALIMAYWVQRKQRKGEFDSQTVNTELKQLGHGVSNITRALDELKKRKPQLVMQVQKSGKSKQARKRYKVTRAGQTKVEQMLVGQPEA